MKSGDRALLKTRGATSAADPRLGGARRNRKTAEVVALDIVRDIVANNAKPGDKLPLEAAMLRQYGVSRSSLREAMRLLEVQGLVTIRPGPGGGTVVGNVNPANLGRTLSLHMHLSGATYDELLNTWVQTEMLLAETAARNCDRAKVRRIMAPFIGERDDDGRHVHFDIAEGQEFHSAVAELAENRVLAFLLMMPGTIVTNHITNSTDPAELASDIVHEHQQIAAAIVEGDAEKAKSLTYEHIHRLAEYFRAYWPRKVGEKIEWL